MVNKDYRLYFIRTIGAKDDDNDYDKDEENEDDVIIW